MTLRNSLTAALGALAVSITLSAVVLPAMAIEPPRCAAGVPDMPDYAKRAGLMARFLDDGGDCSVQVRPPQSLVDDDASDDDAGPPTDDSVGIGQSGGGSSGPVVVSVRR